MFDQSTTEINLDPQNLLPDADALIAWLLNEAPRTQTVWYLNPYTYQMARNGTILCLRRRPLCRGWEHGDPAYRARPENTLPAAQFGFLRLRGMRVHSGRPTRSIHRRDWRNGADIACFTGICLQRHPELDIAFAQHGYFGPEEIDDVVTRLNQAVPPISSWSPWEPPPGSVLRRAEEAGGAAD